MTEMDSEIHPEWWQAFQLLMQFARRAEAEHNTTELIKIWMAQDKLERGHFRTKGAYKECLT